MNGAVTTGIIDRAAGGRWMDHRLVIDAVL
jgi:hypothetical protein